MAKRKTITVLVGLAVAIVGVPVLLFCASGIALDYYEHKLTLCSYRERAPQMGYVQMIEGPEEVYIFLQLYREALPVDPPSKPTWAELIQLPLLEGGRNVRSDIPLVPIQEIIILGRDGQVRRTCIAQPSGVSFHRNLSCIFHFESDLCLLEGPSMNTPARLFRLQGNRFERVPEGEEQAFFQRHLPQEALDSLMKEAGWERLDAEEDLCYQSMYEFQWNSQPVRLGLDATGTTLRLHISSPGPQSAWPESTLEYVADPATMTYAEANAGGRSP